MAKEKTAETVVSLSGSGNATPLRNSGKGGTRTTHRKHRYHPRPTPASVPTTRSTATATLQVSEETPVRSQKIYDRDQSLCSGTTHDARTLRRVRDFLGEIESLGVAASEQHNEGFSGGKYRSYEIRHDVEMVLAAMSDLIDEVGIHEAIIEVVNGSDQISVASP